MTPYLVLYDRRLMGGIPARTRARVIRTDATTALSVAFTAIRRYARGNPLHTLFIVCHGISGVNLKAKMSVDAGGMGLLLGKEDLKHGNVEMWRAIRGVTRNIVVYACAAADTQPDNVATTADGQYLMGALALLTRADVYAADKIQWYMTHGTGRRARIDFGRWEGDIYRFPRSGGRPALVARVPKELSAVL